MSLKKDDLWIGDEVILLKSARRGIYVGDSSDGKCRIKIGGKIILSPISNLELYKAPKKIKKIDLDSLEKKPKLRYQNYNTEVDLHAEAISPDLIKEPPQMILRMQLQVCKKHLDDAIAVGAKIVTIIHGIGKGELKKEVEFLISQYKEVQMTTPKHNGGATEVWFR